MSSCECGAALPVAGLGRIPRFCSTACRMRAYRARHKVPKALTAADRWVRRDGKRPLTVTGAPGSSTNPTTWSSYGATKASKVGNGFGFVLGAGFACLDLDHCLADGVLSDAAMDVVMAHSDAYIEVSPSGTGLHIWGTAPEAAGTCRPGFEAYSAGRYITVTGNVFQPGGLTDLSQYFGGRP